MLHSNTNMDKDNHEIIYLGQVQGKEGLYAIVHKTESYEHFNHNMNYDNIAGYLEGAMAVRPWNVEIANGMPYDVIRTSFPSINIEKLKTENLDKLLEDSKVKHKLRFSIRCF